MKRRMKRNNNRIRAPNGTGRLRVQNTGYSEGGGSRTSNILKAWNPIRSSAKSDIDANIGALRGRSADQATNTPIGAAAIDTSAMHAIGAGLTVSPRLQFKTLGMNVDEAKEWERETAREFDLWAGSTQCDLYRRNNFYDLQNIAYTTYLTDGDSFALFRRKAPSAYMPYSLRIQLIEANRVSNPLGAGVMGYPGPFAVEMRAPNGNRIIDGVEITEDGEITAYWISSKVPYDPTDYAPTTWSRVEAFGKRTGAPNILQICHDIRAEQYRGVPYLAPVLETLKQVSRYTRAELTAAIIKSFFALFFTSSAAGQDLNSILGSEDPKEPVVDNIECSFPERR